MCCSLAACYEPISDCLDPLAANFSLTADNDCDDCCSYPSVNIRFYPVWDTLDIDTSHFYRQSTGDSISIKGAQFFISNLFLTKQSAFELSSQDSVVLGCDVPLTLYNSMKNISLNAQTAQIPSVELDGGYNMIHVDLGIPSCLSTIDTSAVGVLSSSSELFANELASKSYLSHQFDLVWHNPIPVQRTLQLRNAEGLVQLVFQKELDISRGNNLSIDINVDYSVWLDDFRLDDSEETLIQRLIENSSRSFSLRE